MKPARSVARRKPATAAGTRLWTWLLGLFVAVYAAFQVYAPVMYGPFLFDDQYLPFRIPNFSEQLSVWIRGVRPVLMFSYWLNFRASGVETFSYHAVNVLLHALNGFLVYCIARRLLERASVEAAQRNLPALFAAGLFLCHPVQTESVAYVASRSETLSVFFVLAALTVFLYRGIPRISWSAAALVLALFMAALGSKEHTAALFPVLLLSDYYWNPGFSFKGLKANWRLYAPMIAGGVAGAIFFLPLVLRGANAGFNLKDFTWYQYFFTQCRALFVYLRLFVLPVGQTADYEFAVSRTILDHGAIAGMAVLVAITAAAWIRRRQYPLASYGWFMFLLFMAPTSSIMPIQDLVAERRMYLSFPGLLLIVLEFLRRVRADRRKLAVALGAVLVVYAAAAFQRNRLWSDPIAFWTDTASKAPHKPRPRFQLAYAYYASGRCADALPHYEAVSRLQPPAYDLYVDWALAHDCLGQTEPALEKLRRAAALEGTAHAWSMIGMVYAKSARWAEALQALETARKINPAYAMTYVYRGGVQAAQRQFAPAVEDYRRALALDPTNQPAREGLAAAQAALGVKP